MTEYTKVTVMVEEPNGHTQVLTFNRASSPDMKLVPKVSELRDHLTDDGLEVETVVEAVLFSCILRALPDDNGQCVISGSTLADVTAHEAPDVANGPEPTNNDWEEAVAALQARNISMNVHYPEGNTP